jgi:hypothetical protein
MQGEVMKKLSAIFGVLALLAAELVFASASVTSLAGTVTAALGAAPGRPLRQGDMVREGETVTTGAGSSVVLRFDDGQITALVANSRLTITTYQYNPQTQSGNVLLSLVEGGMRAITGLIGGRSPDRVAYRAATATIGIRGTDITVVTSAGNILVTVTNGIISYQFPGQAAVTVNAGNAVATTADRGTITGAAATIIAQLPAQFGVQATNVQQAIQQLSAAITNAVSSSQTQTQTGTPAQVSVATTPTGSGSGSGGGGGSASPSGNR